MSDRQLRSPEDRGEETPESYEPPTVEDLDSTYGPSVTAAGKPTPHNTAAPREL